MSKDWKETLTMPQTEFEARGNLTKKDPDFIKFWEERDVVSKQKNRDKTYILHDGPPYANGNIHVGHALNKILKDIVVRDKMLQGYSTDWRPGWDTHGLPIEWELQKKGVKLTEVGLETYLKKCRNFALSQVEKQEKQFKTLALSADFENKYLTLDHNVETAEIKIFHEMLNKGLAYQDLKPIYWSWSSQTSLAEAEIEYKDKESYSIYVKFKLEDEDKYILIWTTTPWTLPANQGLAFGERINYVLTEIDGEQVILAEELISEIEAKTEKTIKVIESVDPSTLIGKFAINPLNGNKSKVVWGHHVTTEAGTGIVHIAGGHGHDDYIISLNNDLELVVVMDERGIQINAGKYDGEFYLKNEPKIIEDLQANNSLLHVSKFTHSHPVDWRTKEPVVYRATKQWFVSIEQIKDGIIKVIPEVDWNPEWGGERLAKMTKDRQDWCISRQRVWGVPIPVIYDAQGNPIVNKELQEKIEKIFAEEGSYGYMLKDVKDILPESIPYEEGMRKETDILDVWFDSGSVHEAQTPGVQSDVYIEGTDQYRGWFNSSLITSYVMNGKAPYKKIITHGFVTDGNGEKMSKSIGNVIDPLDITKQKGSDVLRLWVASSDYKDNVRISDDILKQVASDYTNIRNRIRFMLGNLAKYDGSKPELQGFPAIAYETVSQMYNNIREYYEANDYSKVIKTIITEINTGIIARFMDYIKDILYVYPVNNDERRQNEFVLNYIVEVLMYSLAPIMPVTMDEVFTTINGKEQSIFETTYTNEAPASIEKWEELKKVIEAFNKQWEEVRTNSEVSKTTEVDVKLSAPSILTAEDYAKLLGVASVELTEGEISVEITPTTKAHKCDRCWKHFDSVNEDGICEMCAAAVAEQK